MQTIVDVRKVNDGSWIAELKAGNGPVLARAIVPAETVAKVAARVKAMHGSFHGMAGYGVLTAEGESREGLFAPPGSPRGDISGDDIIGFSLGIKKLAKKIGKSPTWVYKKAKAAKSVVARLPKRVGKKLLAGAKFAGMPAALLMARLRSGDVKRKRRLVAEGIEKSAQDRTAKTGQPIAASRLLARTFFAKKGLPVPGVHELIPTTKLAGDSFGDDIIGAPPGILKYLLWLNPLTWFAAMTRKTIDEFKQSSGTAYQASTKQRLARTEALKAEAEARSMEPGTTEPMESADEAPAEEASYDESEGDIMGRIRRRRRLARKRLAPPPAPAPAPESDEGEPEGGEGEGEGEGDESAGFMPGLRLRRRMKLMRLINRKRGRKGLAPISMALASTKLAGETTVEEAGKAGQLAKTARDSALGKPEAVLIVALLRRKAENGNKKATAMLGAINVIKEHGCTGVIGGDIGFDPITAYVATKYGPKAAKFAISHKGQIAKAAKVNAKADKGDPKAKTQVTAINTLAKAGDPKAKEAAVSLKIAKDVAKEKPEALGLRPLGLRPLPNAKAKAAARSSVALSLIDLRSELPAGKSFHDYGAGK